MGQHQDKAFVRTFIGVIAVLVAITVGLIILASGTSTDYQDEERAALRRERAEARLQPVAAVRLSGEPMPEVVAKQAPAAAAEPMSADQVVAQVCAGCHQAGVMGAPKLGAAGDWKPRLAQGFDTLVQNAINGIRGMPPKGGNPSLTDEQIREAVTLMLKDAGLSPQ